VRADPVVSVVLPLYQTRAFVAEAIDSVLAQTYGDFELIVIDDGSDDGGEVIANGYPSRDSRVAYFRQENAGLASARNSALTRAKGSYVAFLDSDDVWLPHRLESQLGRVRPDTVIHGDARVIGPGTHADQRISSGVAQPALSDTFASLLAENHIAVLTALVPRELIASVGGFDVTLRSAEDYDLWLRLAARGVRFDYVDDVLAVYRSRPGSLSSDPVWMAQHRLIVYRKLARTVEPSRRQMVWARCRSEQRLLSGELRTRGWQSVAEGRVEDGRSDLLGAVRTAPGWWRSWPLAATLALPFGVRAGARVRGTRTPVAR
jgi:glycosyltransferase involved in cell wall biosynthesis